MVALSAALVNAIRCRGEIRSPGDLDSASLRRRRSCSLMVSFSRRLRVVIRSFVLLSFHHPKCASIHLLSLYLCGFWAWTSGHSHTSAECALAHADRATQSRGLFLFAFASTIIRPTISYCAIASRPASFSSLRPGRNSTEPISRC